MDLLVVVKLVATAVVLGGTVVALSRLGQRGGRRGAGPSLRIVSRTGVSRNATIAVVEVEGRRFLVGTADQNVNLLAELDDPDDRAPVTAVTAPSSPPATSPAGRRTAASPTDPAAARRVAAVWKHARQPHRTGPADHAGPGIGLLDRMRAMTVRSHERPIHAEPR